MPPRRLEDVFKTCLQDVFSVTIFHLPRCLQDVFGRRLQDVLEDEKLLHWRHFEDVFKTCLQDLFKTSSRPVLLISCTSCFHWMFLQLFRIQFFRHRLSRFYYCSCLSEITFSLWLLRLSRKIHFCFCCFDCYYYLKISKQLLPLMSWMNDLKITAQTAHWQCPSGT